MRNCLQAIRPSIEHKENEEGKDAEMGGDSGARSSNDKALDKELIVEGPTKTDVVTGSGEGARGEV